MTTASTVSQKLWNYCNVLRDGALYGWEIVDSAARLGVMNLYLHGIGGHRTNIKVDDSLRNHPGVNFDLALTNPPFGRKSSLTFVITEAERESLAVERSDFWASASRFSYDYLTKRDKANLNTYRHQRPAGYSAPGVARNRGFGIPAGAHPFSRRPDGL